MVSILFDTNITVEKRQNSSRLTFGAGKLNLVLVVGGVGGDSALPVKLFLITP